MRFFDLVLTLLLANLGAMTVLAEEEEAPKRPEIKLQKIEQRLAPSPPIALPPGQSPTMIAATITDTGATATVIVTVTTNPVELPRYCVLPWPPWIQTNCLKLQYNLFTLEVHHRPFYYPDFHCYRDFNRYLYFNRYTPRHG